MRSQHIGAGKVYCFLIIDKIRKEEQEQQQRQKKKKKLLHLQAAFSAHNISSSSCRLLPSLNKLNNHLSARDSPTIVGHTKYSWFNQRSLSSQSSHPTKQHIISLPLLMSTSSPPPNPHAISTPLRRRSPCVVSWGMIS